jgi:general stress protein 26
MDQMMRDGIVRQLQSHRVLSLATLRSDGWPQATVVAYVSDGLAPFFFVSRLSQKFQNIRRDPRVSATIGGDFAQTSEIKGLSLAGRASEVTQPAVLDRVWAMFGQKFPEYASWPKPSAAMTVLLRIDPEIVSLVDYSRGFGHSDLLAVKRDDISGPARAQAHRWLEPHPPRTESQPQD